jgi:hypothetical protein
VFFFLAGFLCSDFFKLSGQILAESMFVFSSFLKSSLSFFACSTPQLDTWLKHLNFIVKIFVQKRQFRAALKFLLRGIFLPNKSTAVPRNLNSARLLRFVSCKGFSRKSSFARHFNVRGFLKGHLAFLREQFFNFISHFVFRE